MAHGEDKAIAAEIRLYGIVQGVGFRPYTARLANEYGLSGFIKNEGGNVYIKAAGEKPRLLAFFEDLKKSLPAGAEIVKDEIEFVKDRQDTPIPFEIRHSEAAQPKLPLPSPDIAVCGDCLRELYAAGDRRYRNAFISCTACGPRFSILERLPYDRQNVSMSAFEMCRGCEDEYLQIADRRFNSETICCNNCGPQLSYTSKQVANGKDPIAEAIADLNAGRIIAVKGIGGYHFVCSAYNKAAVERLRSLKGREKKPFAVMFPSIESIQAHCLVSEEERQLLCSAARPIVLLNRRRSAIDEGVYCESRFIGAFLPYTPIQHLILDNTDPLVMTSANISGRPITIDDGEMRRFFEQQPQLFGLLAHDREICRRLDDSVAAIVAGKTQFYRRARGYVPLPIKVSGSNEALLACGGSQKNTFALCRDGFAYLSGENGDLDEVETISCYEKAAEDFEKVLRIEPEAVCCDLHPRYESTKYAEKRSKNALKVQHHHAHIASVMAEEGLRGPVIGVAFDGTGYGEDGTVWGGEFLIANAKSYERAGHIKPYKLVGSDITIRNTKNTAAALLIQAGVDIGGSADEKLLSAALDTGVNIFLTSSAGRLFDAVSSILNICHRADYEGQAAIMLENAAAGCTKEGLCPFAFELDEKGTVADMLPVIRAVYEANAAGVPVSDTALRFHLTVVQMIFEICKNLRAKYKISDVALSGGVFHNRIILEKVCERLCREGFFVHFNTKVPPGDGGIALGQALIGLNQDQR